MRTLQPKVDGKNAFRYAGLGTLRGGPPLELDAGNLFSLALDGVLYVCENLFIYAFAVVALDFCFKMRFLCPFPIKRSVSRTK